jgi:hypothetical protein
MWSTANAVPSLGRMTGLVGWAWLADAGLPSWWPPVPVPTTRGKPCNTHDKGDRLVNSRRYRMFPAAASLWVFSQTTSSEGEQVEAGDGGAATAELAS